MAERLCPNCDEPVIDKLPPCPLSCMSPKCKAYQKKELINVKEKPIIWILGGPGSGKGTQCDKMRNKYGYTHLSPGDLLRAEVASNSSRSRCLHSILTRGGLVPNDIVLDIIKEFIREMVPTAKGFLIDGYPREKSQGVAFEKAIAPATVIMYFDVARETLLKRLTALAAQSGRIDDTEEAINGRIATFMEHNSDVLHLYKKRVITINAEGTVDSVFAEVQKILDPVVEAARTLAAAAAPVPTT